MRILRPKRKTKQARKQKQKKTKKKYHQENTYNERYNVLLSSKKTKLCSWRWCIYMKLPRKWIYNVHTITARILVYCSHFWGMWFIDCLCMPSAYWFYQLSTWVVLVHPYWFLISSLTLHEFEGSTNLETRTTVRLWCPGQAQQGHY